MRKYLIIVLLSCNFLGCDIDTRHSFFKEGSERMTEYQRVIVETKSKELLLNELKKTQFEIYNSQKIRNFISENKQWNDDNISKYHTRSIARNILSFYKIQSSLVSAIERLKNIDSICSSSSLAQTDLQNDKTLKFFIRDEYLPLLENVKKSIDSQSRWYVSGNLGEDVKNSYSDSFKGIKRKFLKSEDIDQIYKDSCNSFLKEIKEGEDLKNLLTLLKKEIQLNSDFLSQYKKIFHAIKEKSNSKSFLKMLSEDFKDDSVLGRSRVLFYKRDEVYNYVIRANKLYYSFRSEFRYLKDHSNKIFSEFKKEHLLKNIKSVKIKLEKLYKLSLLNDSVELKQDINKSIEKFNEFENTVSSSLLSGGTNE